MIERRLLTRLILGVAILSVASISAFALGSRTFHVSVPVSLNGTQMAAGDYEVSWQTHSPEATVTFTKGRKVIATAPGRLVERDVKYDHDMMVYEANADGSYTISELRFAGKRQVIVFGH